MFQKKSFAQVLPVNGNIYFITIYVCNAILNCYTKYMFNSGLIYRCCGTDKQNFGASIKRNLLSRVPMWIYQWLKLYQTDYFRSIHRLLWLNCNIIHCRMVTKSKIYGFVIFVCIIYSDFKYRNFSIPDQDILIKELVLFYT